VREADAAGQRARSKDRSRARSKRAHRPARSKRARNRPGRSSHPAGGTAPRPPSRRTTQPPPRPSEGQNDGSWEVLLSEKPERTHESRVTGNPYANPKSAIVGRAICLLARSPSPARLRRTCNTVVPLGPVLPNMSPENTPTPPTTQFVNYDYLSQVAQTSPGRAKSWLACETTFRAGSCHLAEAYSSPGRSRRRAQPRANLDSG